MATPHFLLGDRIISRLYDLLDRLVTNYRQFVRTRHCRVPTIGNTKNGFDIKGEYRQQTTPVRSELAGSHYKDGSHY